MRNLKLIVRYDGTDFHGWQTQPGLRTVQETLENAIKSITGESKIFANCTGRTDAGVHAYGQVANVFTNSTLPPDTLLKAINSKLPHDMIVRACTDATQAFDANKDAISKRYRYVINDARIPDPFLMRDAWQPRRVLNAELMQTAAQVLVGKHDFRSFETNWPNRLTSVRTIFAIDVQRHDETVHMEVEADGFLYNMVRSIAGTLYLIGRSYWPEAAMRDVLLAQDRRRAGPTAPPQGLVMLWVKFAENSLRNRFAV